ncbi:hypothetical protein [Campylobacter concisus]|nr:hypothetical protein [Campylobacter concisus]
MNAADILLKFTFSRLPLSHRKIAAQNYSNLNDSPQVKFANLILPKLPF